MMIQKVNFLKDRFFSFELRICASCAIHFYSRGCILLLLGEVGLVVKTHACCAGSYRVNPPSSGLMDAIFILRNCK